MLFYYRLILINLNEIRNSGEDVVTSHDLTKKGILQRFNLIAFICRRLLFIKDLHSA